MRHNHLWRVRAKRAPLDPIIVLQCIGAGGMLVAGLAIIALVIIAAGVQ